jgi:hypothetical protein
VTVCTVVRNNFCPYILIMSGKADACADEGPKHKQVKERDVFIREIVTVR